ncbi:TatD family hydrolase [Saccharospirillum salsuginis]|uniref:Metal-dependent hydrolase n=1 Tax=Saccharospirillum salsuginis TaxID=418750 RepID=A0A918K363_9GAMM|nr:TatD family hydrolase [Saccharospirillum salsuginis]GGX46137.1 metal-dependent hydrolase [Saccharospirillum salsuginis]
MPWIDSHCHLDYLPDPPNAMARAEENDIRHWILPGTDPSQWQRTQHRFERDPRVHLAFGHHPWFLPEHDAEMGVLSRQLDDSTTVVAIGETGLDYYNGQPKRPPADHQEAWFEQHLRLAQDRNLPVIIHAVKAHDRVLHYLKQYPRVTGVIHAFSGPYEQAMAYIDKGWRLGCGSLILKSGKTRDAFARIPADRLLLETDAPDMRPKHPVHTIPLLDLLQTADDLAEARGVTTADLMAQTSANTRTLFGI